MQNRTQQTAWFTWILGTGVVLAALLVAASWFGNMFHLMGETATAADREAFGDTKRLAVFIVGGSAVFGQIVQLLASGLREPASESESWSNRHREDARARRRNH